MAGKQIRGITIEIDGDTSKLGKALQEVEKKSRSTNQSLKEIEKNLKFNPGNTELVAQQQRKLQDAISETKEKLVILKNADEQAKKQLANGEISQDQYDALQREIIATEKYLESYEKRLGTSQNEQAKFDKATGSIATVLEKSGKSIDDFSDILGEDLVNAYKKGEGSSADMEKALDKLGQELLGTGGDAEKLEERLNKLEDGISFDDIVKEAKKTGDEFGYLGEEAKDSKDNIQNINKTAVSVQGLNAVIDLFGRLKDTVSDAISSIQEAWAELDEGLDTITKKTGSTGDATKEFKKIYDDVYSSMPVKAQSVGEAIGELNTQFGLQDDELKEATESMLKYAEINDADVTQSTINAKKAMSQFRLEGSDLNSVLDIVTKTAQNTGASTDSLLSTVADSAPILQGMNLSFEESVALIGEFEQNGINGSKALGYLTKAQSASAKDGKSLNQSLSEFTKLAQSGASDTEKLNEASKLFGSKGGAMMLKMAKDGALSFEDLKTKVSDSAGAVIETYENILDPADKWTVAQNNIKIAMSEVSNVAQEALAPVLDAIVEVIKNVVEWFTSLDGTTQTIIVTIGGVVAGLTVLATIIAAISAAFTVVAPLLTAVAGGFGAVFGAIKGLFVFVASNPIVLIVTAIIGAVYLLIKNWNWVKEQAVSLWKKITEVWEGIKTSISDVWDSISSFTTNIWDGIKNNITKIWDGIKIAVSSAINGVEKTVTNVFDTLKNTVTNIWDGIKDAIWKPIDWAKRKVAQIVDGIKGLFNFEFKWPHIPLPHFTISGSLNPINWLKNGLPSIGVSWYAKGGIFDKPSVIGVGEAGSEAVIPTNKLDAFLAEGVERVLKNIKNTDGGNGKNIVINVQEMNVREDNDIRRIAEEVIRQMSIQEQRRLNLGGLA